MILAQGSRRKGRSEPAGKDCPLNEPAHVELHCSVRHGGCRYFPNLGFLLPHTEHVRVTVESQSSFDTIALETPGTLTLTVCDGLYNRARENDSRAVGHGKSALASGRGHTTLFDGRHPEAPRLFQRGEGSPSDRSRLRVCIRFANPLRGLPIADSWPR